MYPRRNARRGTVTLKPRDRVTPHEWRRQIGRAPSPGACRVVPGRKAALKLPLAQVLNRGVVASHGCRDTTADSTPTARAASVVVNQPDTVRRWGLRGSIASAAGGALSSCCRASHWPSRWLSSRWSSSSTGSTMCVDSPSPVTLKRVSELKAGWTCSYGQKKTSSPPRSA
eukprot:scaffold43641_cov46-Phaeocystis_antarctica.AAC.1